MVRYSFQEQAEMMLVYAKQVETVERQHKCTEPRTLTGSTTHIALYLEPFIGVSVNKGRLRQANVQDGRGLCVQMWRKMLSLILRTTLVQAPGNCPTNMV